MNTKRCKQCGEVKPQDKYRQYYGGRRGSYKTCLDCERINSRVKYLTGKAERRTDAETEELDKIHKLWDLQRVLGLQPPRLNAGSDTPLNIDDTINKYATMLESVTAQEANTAPIELVEWLTKELTSDPDYYLDVVYDSLREKYMPITHIDSTTKLPVRDRSHSSILEDVLNRFNKYEDDYYGR